MDSVILRLMILMIFWITGIVAVSAAELIPYGGSWRYFLGVREPSEPARWRLATFNDSGWATGAAPLGYANPPNATAEATIATLLPSSQEAGYASLFLRSHFVAKSPGAADVLTINVHLDDGCVVWLNGHEIGRHNFPEGGTPHDAWALSAIEPTLVSFTFTNQAGWIVPGTNLVAIQVFNAAASSSDLFFDAQVEGSRDEAPPQMVSIDPPAGSTLAALTRVSVVFSENVTGVNASDLQVNGSPASAISPISLREYAFSFPEPPFGVIRVDWAAASGIADLAGNPFAGGTWTYQLERDPGPSRVVISEFLADNNHGIEDEDGASSDWIELLNHGSTIASLEGWFLTDSPANLTRWRFPPVTLDPGQYRVLFASGKNRTNLSAPLHTNFKLEKSGGFLALVDAQTNVVSTFSSYPPQREDISFGRDPVSTELTGYLNPPTPSAANVSSGPGFGPPVAFSLPGAVYTNNSIIVTLSASDGQIRYTTDGSVPGSSSPLYNRPITLTASTAVKARTFVPGLLPGPVTAGHYTLVDGTVGAFSSNLPLLILTAGRGVSSSVSPGQARTFAGVAAIDTFRGRSSPRGETEFIGGCELEVRGQSSTGFPKLGYNLEFQDAHRRDLDVGLFGLPAGSDWALYNPYSDKPFLQNFLAYELYGKMGHYSVRHRFVEVYLDTNGGKVTPADYAGLYLLVEKIKIGRNRVEIDPLTPYALREPELSGGYMFKKDKDSAGDRNFSTVGGGGFSPQALKIHEPKPREITPAQFTWLRNYLVQFERALYAPTWKTATGTNHYSHYIDLDSFVDYHWIVEFAKQIDGYRLSNYFYKPRGGPVHMSPIWDWNLSFGNADYLDGANTANWYWRLCGETEHIWLRRLMCGSTDSGGTTGDPDFNQRIIDRWSELRTNVLSSTRVVARVHEMATLLNEAAQRDFQRWPRLGTYVWPNPPLYSQPTTYAGIIRSMTNWIKGRYTWIDSQFLPVPAASLPGGIIPPGSTTTLGPASPGSIYFSLNGADPRAPGGSVSPAAIRYTGPITVTANSKLFARRRNGTTWSGPLVQSYAIHRPALAVTEIMFHPPAPPGGTAYDADDFQYVELKNAGDAPLELQGIEVSGAIQFRFASGILAPGAHLVIVRNQAAFRSRFGSSPAVAGAFTGVLSHRGGQLIVTGNQGELIANITFSDDWHPLADGAGFSLALRSETTSGTDLNEPSRWRASVLEGGSPGRADPPAHPPVANVVLNELLLRPAGGTPQQIELHNLSASIAEVGGWFLSDDLQEPRRFQIPNGARIPPQGFLVLSLANSEPAALLRFNPEGGEAWLFSANSAGQLTGHLHHLKFGGSMSGTTLGRHVDSTGTERVVIEQSATLGQPNAGPRPATVILSEIQYHPPDVWVGQQAWNDTESEFVELHNRGGQPVLLADPARPTNTWRIEGGIQFAFPTNTTLAAGESILLVNFDPLLDPARLASFRAKYALSSSVPLFGPYQGNLSNDRERVSLLRPDSPALGGGPASPALYVVEDEIDYLDQFPWPPGADGLGFSLTRGRTAGYGNDPALWEALRPTPGQPATTRPLPQITRQPASQFAAPGQNISFTIEAAGTGLSYQWFFHGQPLPGATTPFLSLTNVQPHQTGGYHAVVLDGHGAAASHRAFLEVAEDRDGDRIPDRWEFAYQLNPFDPADAAGDGDADRSSNLAEYLAATDPRAPSDHLSLEISPISQNPKGELHFRAAPNRSYSVLYSDTLAAGRWQKLLDIPARPEAQATTVTDPTRSLSRYYRLVTPSQ